MRTLLNLITFTNVFSATVWLRKEHQENTLKKERKTGNGSIQSVNEVKK
jgi:hypothetical protein